MTSGDILSDLGRTTEDVFSSKELELLLGSGKQIRIKYGVDVTSPFLHIGHAVNLWMMRRLQDAGHKVVFLIGDYTTRIGDPTGKDQTRPIIPLEEIERNVQAFIDQAAMVLRFDDPNLLEIRRNSEWYEAMPTGDFLRLLSMMTHARLLSRDMFQRRVERGDDIYLHEFVYPILQGYDSVMLESDLTIIGSDQLFNEMQGRFYQERFGQKPQVIVTSRITPGTDGKAKQSKSLGNYIGLGHSPRDKFGRAMSIPDRLIADYFEVYTEVPLAEIRGELGQLIRSDPMESKKRLASAIVERYHGPDVAQEERAWFESAFSAREQPEDAPELLVPDAALTALDLLRLADPGLSGGQAKRLVEQGAVRLNGRKLSPGDRVSPIDGDSLKFGKRSWRRIRTSA